MRSYGTSDRDLLSLETLYAALPLDQLRGERTRAASDCLVRRRIEAEGRQATLEESMAYDLVDCNERLRVIDAELLRREIDPSPRLPAEEVKKLPWAWIGAGAAVLFLLIRRRR
jgi:hypothetical protein